MLPILCNNAPASYFSRKNTDLWNLISPREVEGSYLSIYSKYLMYDLT